MIWFRYFKHHENLRVAQEDTSKLGGSNLCGSEKQKELVKCFRIEPTCFAEWSEVRYERKGEVRMTPRVLIWVTRWLSGAIYCIRNICREGVWWKKNTTFFNHVDFDICLLDVQVEMLSKEAMIYESASLIYRDSSFPSEVFIFSKITSIWIC